MAAMCDEKAVLTFQNTGREHPGTYEFLRKLDDALGGRIVWLEFRKPKTKGDAPKNFGFEIVDHRTADKTGKPFSDFMEAIAEYRMIHKNESHVSPSSNMRICTAYMKARVQKHYIESLGISEYDSMVGLRSDEPTRVSRMIGYSTQRVSYRCPLSDAGITKPDVMDFWKRQTFDLKIE